jgi:Lrp/AsnC family leucine-responsive transcriptional regulator
MVPDSAIAAIISSRPDNSLCDFMAAPPVMRAELYLLQGSAYFLDRKQLEHLGFEAMAVSAKSLKTKDSGLDEIDQALIALLSDNARLSHAELARSVGLSPPSVAERLRRLEEDGVVSAYTVELDPKALGYTLTAIVRIRPLPGQLHHVEKLLIESPEVIECDKVTGDDCFVARYLLRSIDELDPILERIAQRAQTSTSIVKASPVKRRLPAIP